MESKGKRQPEAAASPGLRLMVLVGWCIAASSQGHTQVEVGETLLFSPEPQAQSFFGRNVLVEDLNDDGFGDLVVSEPESTVSGLTDAGQVYVLWGPDYATTSSLQRAALAAFEEFGGGALAAGDIDGDGHQDVVVGCDNWWLNSAAAVGHVHVFYGPAFEMESVIDNPVPRASAVFGATVLLVDVIGDSRADLVVGAPGMTVALPQGGFAVGAGAVFVFEAPGLAPPVALVDPQVTAGAAFGSSLDAGLFDGDARQDLFVSAPELDLPGCCPSKEGAVHVYAGGTLALLQTIPAPIGGLRHFGDVAYVGDLDGDGDVDLIVEAPQSSLPQCAADGVVVVLPGPDFDTVESMLESPLECQVNTGFNFGSATTVMDLDGDGHLDVVVGDATQAVLPDQVFVFFGPDFESVQVIGDAFDSIVHGFGVHVAQGDVTGDGRPELVVTALQGSLVGSVFVYDVSTLQAEDEEFSVSTGGVLSLSIDLGSGHAGEAYLAAIGLSGSTPGLIVAPGVYLPLNVDGTTFIGLGLVGTPYFPGFAGTLDTAGRADMAFWSPPGQFPELIGLTLTVAAVTGSSLERLGAGTSDVSVLFVP